VKAGGPGRKERKRSGIQDGTHKKPTNQPQKKKKKNKKTQTKKKKKKPKKKKKNKTQKKQQNHSISRDSAFEKEILSSSRDSVLSVFKEEI